MALAAVATLAACTGAAGYVPSNMPPQDQAFFDQLIMCALKDASTAQVRNVRVYQRENGARMMVATVPRIDYSKPFINPVTALGGLGAIDCAGVGYQV